MVEAGSPEVLPQPLIEALLVAKDDSQQDSASLAVKFTRHRVCKPASQAIAEASEAAAMSGQPPAVTGQHDVDAVASEPGSLVEAVTRPARKLRFGAHLEDAALRGCPAKRQLELSRLVERDEAEPPDAHRHLQVESSPPRCRRDDDECSLGAPDFGAQGAVIETLEPCASPPPARHDEQAGDRPDGTPEARGEADRRRASKRNERREADEIRERDPEAERGEQRVRRRAERGRDHGATRSLSWSSRASVAVLRWTGPLEGALAPAGPGAAPSAAVPCLGTTTCSPSASGAARVISSRSAFAV